ncbi:MAG: glycosyltransferase [Halioglobus sp.]|nr:glycosyltransferase [Halioglobus sp.]
MQKELSNSKREELTVLHIGKYFPPFAGGMENYLRDLMEEQSRQGVHPSALVHHSNLCLMSTKEVFRAGVENFPVYRAALWGKMLFTPISPTFLWLLHKAIKQQKPDILHLHMPNVSAFWALFLPGARRIPWVIHWHADVLASNHSRGLRLFYRIYKPFESALLRKSARIISTSPPYLQTSKPLAPYRAKCDVVPLGLKSPQEPNDALPAEAKDNEVLQVLAIGRLTYYKGFGYLIRAVATLSGVHVHLVGAGELKSELKQLAQSTGATEKITFHGKLPDKELQEQFEACDCLCLPSIERTEAFGMVLLEAMSHGKATIISDVPGSGMGWVVENGITGIHTTPESEADLAMALQNLRDNRAKIHDLGRQGRGRFERLFRISKSATGVNKLYASTIANNTKKET